MIKAKVLCLIGISAGLLLTCWAENVYSRQNILTGGAGFRYIFTERDYDDSGLGDISTGDRREYAVWPDLEFQSLDTHNSLLVYYRPEFVYDDVNSEADVNHYFDLDWQQNITRKWSYQLTDRFEYTNDPTEDDIGLDTTGEDLGGGDELSGDILSRNLGTRRYWTNMLEFLSAYNYALESRYQFGYTYRVLRDDSSGDDVGYEEYDRHGVSLLWTHRYSQFWRSELDFRYYKGLFDDLEDTNFQDLDEYIFNMQADYSRSESNFFPVIYKYQRVEYEDQREDIWGHELSINWDYTFDARNHLIVGAGPSYVDSDDLDGELGYNFLFNYIRSYQHGRFEALAEKQYLSRHFSGIDDSGLSDVITFRLSATYQASREIAFDVFAQYRYREILNPVGDYYEAALEGRDPATEDELGDFTYTRDAISAGASISYDIMNWLTASLGYEYFIQDGDVSGDAFDDHRVLLQLSVSTEFWR